MIAGAHFLLYTRDPEADRGFFKTVLEFPSVDPGDGWLIFALPHAQLAVHPGDGEFVQTHAEWGNQHQCSAADRRCDRSLSTDSPYDD